LATLFGLFQVRGFGLAVALGFVLLGRNGASQSLQPVSSVDDELVRLCMEIGDRLDRHLTSPRLNPPDDGRNPNRLVDPTSVAQMSSDIEQALLAGLATRPQFSALRDYVALNLPPPPRPDVLDPVLQTPRLSRDALKTYGASLNGFLGRLRTLRPLAIDITLKTIPSEADVELRTSAVTLPTSRSDTLLKNVYRGHYVVRVTKPKFKPATVILNLIDDSRPTLECLLATDHDEHNQSSCRRQ
jgi:hypothetical protein